MPATKGLPWALGLVIGCGGGDGSSGPEPYPEGSEQTCSNGYDDDLDDAIDCLDEDCAAFCGGDADTDVDTDVDTDTDSDPPDPCDVIAQTGCDAGEACKLSWAKCDPAITLADCIPSVSCLQPGAAPLGQTCSVSADCESGLTCWQTCRPACHDATDCGPVPAGLYDSSGCFIVQEGWGYCTLPCDPLSPGSCGGGAQCMLIVDGDLPSTDCVVDVGTALAGDDCSRPLQCAPGTACDGDPGGGFTCGDVCDTDEDCAGTCQLLAGGLIGTCR